MPCLSMRTVSVQVEMGLIATRIGSCVKRFADALLVVPLCEGLCKCSMLPQRSCLSLVITGLVGHLVLSDCDRSTVLIGNAKALSSLQPWNVPTSSMVMKSSQIEHDLHSRTFLPKQAPISLEFIRYDMRMYANFPCAS